MQLRRSLSASPAEVAIALCVIACVPFGIGRKQQLEDRAWLRVLGAWNAHHSGIDALGHPPGRLVAKPKILAKVPEGRCYSPHHNRRYPKTEANAVAVQIRSRGDAEAPMAIRTVEGRLRLIACFHAVGPPAMGAGELSEQAPDILACLVLLVGGHEICLPGTALPMKRTEVIGIHELRCILGRLGGVNV